MKSIILIACLIVAASSAPQETQQTEGTKTVPSQAPVPVPAEKKSAKLQTFGPADGQFYSTGAVVPEAAGVQTYSVGHQQHQVVYQTEQLAPSYYSNGVQVPAYYNGNGVAYPYAGVQATVAAPAGSELPANHVWEHQGSSHIGHLGSAVHVKRNGGSYYYTSPVVSAVAGYPASSSAWATTNGAWTNGAVQYINGQPAQYLNGQWYYVNQAQIQPAVYGGVAANRPNVPSSTTVYQSPLYNVKSFQPQNGFVAVPRPAVYAPAVANGANKWYTKTNVQPINGPFYGQVPHHAAHGAVAGVKTVAAPVRPDVSAVVSVDGERADWKS